MKTKWVWEDNWKGKVGCAALFKDGTTKAYKQSRCMAIPNCEIIVEEGPIGWDEYRVRMRFTNIFWMEERIFDVKLPKSIKTLRGAQRQARAIVQREVARIIKEQTTKYQNILDCL